jgi:hypothetical protein
MNYLFTAGSTMPPLSTPPGFLERALDGIDGPSDGWSSGRRARYHTGWYAPSLFDWNRSDKALRRLAVSAAEFESLAAGAGWSASTA